MWTSGNVIIIIDVINSRQISDLWRQFPFKSRSQCFGPPRNESPKKRVPRQWSSATLRDSVLQEIEVRGYCLVCHFLLRARSVRGRIKGARLRGCRLHHPTFFLQTNMRFTSVIVLALSAAASATAVLPRDSCNTGPIQCCNQVQNVSCYHIDILTKRSHRRNRLPALEYPKSWAGSAFSAFLSTLVLFLVPLMSSLAVSAACRLLYW